MAEIIITIILMIPLYGLLIWTYIEPEESILLGRRWMYKEEPELSQKVIRYTKFVSLIAMIGLPISIICFLVEIKILRLVPVLFLMVIAVGALIILSADDNDSEH